jgi:membrane-associated phospholipid phosphatase
MYRGMHHPLDVAGGLLDVAALIVVFACRTAGAAAEPANEGCGDRTLRQDRWRWPFRLRRVLDGEGIDDPLWCECRRP